MGRAKGNSAASIQCISSHRSEEHTSELQSHSDLVCRLLLEKKKQEELLRFLVRVRTRASYGVRPLRDANSLAEGGAPVSGIHVSLVAGLVIAAAVERAASFE